MEENAEIWRKYYEKALKRPHSFATQEAESKVDCDLKVAIDCGCGTGSDVAYLADKGYQVHGFDINSDAIAICRDRFGVQPLVDVTQSAFESFDYPKASLVVAHSSLFFADPQYFPKVWQRIEACIDIGGVFAGDFMGEKDSWASNYRSPTTPLTRAEVADLLANFEVISFTERDEHAKTSLGRMKHWHTFSVIAIKRSERGQK